MVEILHKFLRLCGFLLLIKRSTSKIQLPVGIYYWSFPCTTAGIIRVQLLFEGGSYMRKYGTLWEVPIARIWKNMCRKVIFGIPNILPLLGVLGAWMTFKKAEMAKTLKNGLSMIEKNPLNHNWSHFMILLGLTLQQFQKKLLLSLPNALQTDVFW